jgi:hypothetical protein
MVRQHRDSQLGQRHSVENWRYADAAARTAATGFVASDVHKLALQLDDGSYWRLSNHSPVTWAAVAGGGGGSGTVTSVALTVPADLAVSGTPVTTSGTLAVTRNTQLANRVLAGPASGGAAVPAYRALVAADIPTHPHATGDITGLTEAVQDIVGAMIVAGTNMGTITYDDTAGTVTVNGLALSTEQVQDIVGAMVQAGANVTVTYDDTLGTLTVAATGGGGGGVTVEEEDGTPTVAVVSKIQVPNGTLTDDGAGTVSLNYYSIAAVDAALAGKSNTGHTHTASNITDFVEALGDATAALLVEGAGIDLVYDDGAGTLTIALTGTLDANARVGVRKNSAGATFTRRRVNFIEGTNVTITVADDATDEEVDVTIAASGGGGSISVEEMDGTPDVAAVNTIRVPNGSLTDETGGVVSLDYARSSHAHAGTDITTGTVDAARLPDASTTAKGVVELATSGENAAGVVVQGNDARLSDARTPTAHTHPSTEITDFGEATYDTVAAILVAGTNVTLTPNDTNNTVTIAASGGGSGHSIEDEGTPLTARSKLNFVGAGVTVTDDSGDDASVVTIPGGGGSASFVGIAKWGTD